MKNKAIIIILGLSIFALLSVHSTYAVLSDKTDTLINTFTIGDYLAVMSPTNGDTVAALDNSFGIKKSQIGKIYTLTSNEVPSSAIKSWDVSSRKNGSIMAYVIDEDKDGLYELYIGQNGGVHANPNSTKLFNFYSKLTSADLSNLITDDVKTMEAMFQMCSSLKTIEVSDWNTSKVTTMAGMFSYCSSLTNINVGCWDTSKVTVMSSMFNKCSSLTNIDVSNWDTSKVTMMAGMFNECSSLTNINASQWNTSKVKDMQYMFSNCSSLTNIDVSKWNTAEVTNMQYMFSTCSSLTDIDVSKWDTSKVTNISFMFYKCNELTSLNVSGFNTKNVTTMESIFDNCSNLSLLDVSKWVTSAVTDMSYMFNGCSSLTNIDVSSWNTIKVTNMEFMFSNCPSLTNIDVSKWNTAEVTNMQYMFNNCSSLTDIDVSKWDTSKVTVMSSMFNKCSSLTNIDVSKWDTSKVINMYFMFNECRTMKNLDISTWNMTNVTNARAMFQYMTSATTIKMPDNYSLIENFMFNHNRSYDKETFTIPNSVKSVGDSHIFYDFGTTNFKKFIVASGNTTVKTIDDILYSYDRTTLISIPMGKTFADNKFTIPEGVTKFNILSFNRSKNIETVVLPNSYEIIRYQEDSTSGDNDYVKGNSINTGIYVFTSVSKYEVKDDNSNYSSSDGCIYNKDGTELIAVPVHYNGELNIKNTTTTIGQEAFWVQRVDHIDSITKINIPASVTTIEKDQLATLNKLAAKGVIINIDPLNTTYQLSNNKIIAK